MATALGRVSICEVGPRDGLQNEARTLPVPLRIALIERLAGTGVTKIEAVSFVDDRRVPQMADAEAVMVGIRRRPRVKYCALVLNERGADRALAAQVDEIHFAMASTETFNERNQGTSLANSLELFRRLAVRSKTARVGVTATVATAFGCPFEGVVPLDRVVGLASDLVAAGADEIVIADTIGVAAPTQVIELVRALARVLGGRVPIGAHFHNTRNTGLANAFVAVSEGVRSLDASVGGTGGCPYAPGATGNIPTEDLTYMLNRSGFETGVNLEEAIRAAEFLEGLLGKPLPGMLMKAGPFPVPQPREHTAADGRRWH